MKVKYNDRENFEVIADCLHINFERVRLMGAGALENTSGFDVYDDNDNLLYSCPNHKVVYEKGEGFVEYTNDTYTYYVYLAYDENCNVTEIFSSWQPSVENAHLISKGQGKEFAEPTTDLIFIDDDGFYNYRIVDGEVIEIAMEEKSAMKAERDKKSFETSKKQKIKESKDLLALYLENHPMVSDCYKGMKAAYNVTMEKQNLMTSHYATYTIEKNMGLNPVLKWNSTGAECEEWAEEEFISLMLEIKAYVEPLVSMQQAYEVQIRDCITQEELDAIKIMYDVYGIAE